MNIPAKYRSMLYVALMVVALCVAAAIVFGFVTQAQVLAVIEIGTMLFAAFVGLLARLNVTPDE